MELKDGQKVTFNYNGSQEAFQGRQEGIVVMVPEIRWQGGQVPGLEDRGYATEIKILEDK